MNPVDSSRRARALELRSITGCHMGDALDALDCSDGDMLAAVDLIRAPAVSSMRLRARLAALERRVEDLERQALGDDTKLVPRPDHGPA